MYDDCQFEYQHRKYVKGHGRRIWFDQVNASSYSSWFDLKPQNIITLEYTMMNALDTLHTSMYGIWIANGS